MAEYARTLIDASNATGPTLSKPFEDVAKATHNANKAGLTTDDFLRIVDKMAEFAYIISTEPGPAREAKQQPNSQPPDESSRRNFSVSFPTMSPEDRILFEDQSVSPKKRMLLSGFGFFERVYNLLGTSAQLTGPPDGNSLLTVLRSAIAALSKLINS